MTLTKTFKARKRSRDHERKNARRQTTELEDDTRLESSRFSLGYKGQDQLQLLEFTTSIFSGTY